MFKISYRFSTRIVTCQSDTLKLFRKYYTWKPKRIYAFYNSEFDKIITQQHLMLMPIDERLATRSHAASHIISIKNQKIINFQSQAKLLFEKAKSLAIQPCLKEDILLSKVIDTVKAAFLSYLYENTKQDLQKQIFFLRVIFSSGHGDFGIAARDNGCVFYAIVSQAQHKEENGVSEYTTKQINFNIQEYNLNKTGSEIQNSMMKSEAQQKGGFSGIKYTKDRIILEASSGNLGFVFEDKKELIVPRMNKVNVNPTLKEAISYLSSSVDQPKIKVIQKDVSIQQAYLAKQIVIFGKDKIIPVLYLDQHLISESKGQITKKLQKWYGETIEKGISVEI